MSEFVPQKKLPTTNYTLTEKSNLCTILAQFKNTIECKKSNSLTWKDKERAWEQVACQFNASSQNATYRSAESLKKCYENIKQTTKKQCADERFEIKKTGGGCVQNVSNPIYEQALSLMNVKTVNGLQNSFDSDAIAIPTNLEDDDFMVEMLPDATNDEYSAIIDSLRQDRDEEHMHVTHSSPGIIDADYSTTSADKNWRHYTPNDLKRPANKKLQITNDQKVSMSTANKSSIETSKKSEVPIANPKKNQSQKNTPSKSSERRPGIIGLSSTNLLKEYSDLANIKPLIAQEHLKTLQSDAEAVKIKRAEEEMEHKMRMKTLELHIEIKKLQAKRLKHTFDA